MEERITDLEVRFMHQEKIISDLNDTVCRQELAIVRLERELHEEFGTQRLALVSRGKAVEFAAFLGPADKAELATDLSQALANARRGPRFS